MVTTDENGWKSNPNKMKDDFYYAYFGHSLKKEIVIRAIMFLIFIILAVFVGMIEK